MSTFLQVVPQHPAQTSASSISISKPSRSRSQQEFEKYKQNLLSHPGQTLYDYCQINGLSYDTLRGYASYKRINIRSLRKESLSRTGNYTNFSEVTDTPSKKEPTGQIHVTVKIRNISLDITGVNTDDISAMIERMADHV